jgi:hypothetical protein
MKNPFKNIAKKVVACPSCNKKSRIPIRPNKTLEITCPGCQSVFQIHFKNPLSDFFTWYKGKGLFYNLKSYWYRYKHLPFGMRLKIFIISFLIIYSLVGSLSMTKSKSISDQNNDNNKEIDPYAAEI